MTQEKHHHCPVELCLKVARLVVGISTVVGVCCTAHEIHRLHKAVEHFREDHAKKHKLL